MLHEKRTFLNTVTNTRKLHYLRIRKYVLLYLETCTCYLRSTVGLVIDRMTVRTVLHYCCHFLPADETESVRVTLDLECECVRRRSSLRSFASFRRCANSFWYSAASSRFFVARRRFCARRWRLRCSTSGVTRRWILGAFVLAFLPTTNDRTMTSADQTHRNAWKPLSLTSQTCQHRRLKTGKSFLTPAKNRLKNHKTLKPL